MSPIRREAIDETPLRDGYRFGGDDIVLQVETGGPVSCTAAEFDGDDIVLQVETHEGEGRVYTVARAGGPGVPTEHEGMRALVLVDGARILRRIGKLVETGAIPAASLPLLVVFEPKDPLCDFTPWPHPAYKSGAPDFGGGADEFLQSTVLPAAEFARCLAGGESCGGVGLLGYSLSALFGLHAMTRTDAFDEYLLASPSSWYPGFVNCLARTPLPCDPRVAIACGVDEGAGHPEPLLGTRQETDRLVAILGTKLTRPPLYRVDTYGHHDGLSVRLSTLLEAFRLPGETMKRKAI